MSANPDSVAPLREFVIEMTRLVERTTEEAVLIADGRQLLSRLIEKDDWLPEEFAQVATDTYRQYLLYCDPLERFSVVSFVWGPGHRTPVHDHTVWGLVGQLRGAERCTEYQQDGAQVTPTGVEHLMNPGDIDAVSPTLGDWHVVASARDDGPSISIHVYGANIGAVSRHMVDAGSGQIKPFVSGYSSQTVPNLWDRSAQVRAAIA